MINYFTEDKLIDYLALHFSQHNLAHAFIISGQSHNNKKDIIYHFLQKILPNSTNLASRLTMGSFPDLLTIDKNDKNEITIAEIRKAIQFCSLSPIEAECKIIIINQADLLNMNASNALLKVLEEPYGNTLFFLLSDQPQQLLPTIRSRCQSLRLQNPKEENVAESEYYQKLLALITDDDFIKFEQFAEQCFAKNQNPESWQKIQNAISIILSQVIKTQADIPTENSEIARLVLRKKDIAHWLDLFSEWQELSDNTELLNLDKKQTLWHMFNKMKAQ